MAEITQRTYRLECVAAVERDRRTTVAAGMSDSSPPPERQMGGGKSRAKAKPKTTVRERAREAKAAFEETHPGAAQRFDVLGQLLDQLKEKRAKLDEAIAAVERVRSM